MGMYHNRPHVQDLRAMKKRGEKISMLYVSTHDEAAAAAAAGIHMLSIEGKVFDAAMREAAEAMRLTAQDLLKLGVIDQIIAEPRGGAQRSRRARD